MYDSRYPHMHRIASAPGVDPQHRSRLVKIADAICRRTGIRCSYNAFNERLFFHYTPEPDSGPFALPVFDQDGHPIRYSDNDIDDAVRYIQYGKMSRSQKDKIGRQKEQMDRWTWEDKMNRHLDERRPSGVDYARYLDQKRRGVSKVIST